MSSKQSDLASRFGDIVRKRRTDLELNQLEVSAAGGPSNTLQTEIENGRLDNLTASTAKKIDKALRWEPGSARRAWLGGDPVPYVWGTPELEQVIDLIEQSKWSDESKRHIINKLRDRLQQSKVSDEDMSVRRQQ